MIQGDAFPNYTQLRPVVPAFLWWVLRALTLGLTLFVIFMLFTVPDTGLTLLWQILIPLLPLSFAIVPGLWRNICPMALLNQLPRQFGLSRGVNLPNNWRRLALYFSVVMFLAFILLRRPLLDHSAAALGALLTGALLLALVGGLIFKGRSGWCGTFCPLAPLQKAYGHAPLLLVRNGYCETCVGCQKNCYDFNPRAAFFSDLEDSETEWSEQRKFFIAFLPGLILAYFGSVYPVPTDVLGYLRDMLFPPLASTGIFYLLHNLAQINYFRLASVYAMTALGIFYWHALPVMNDGMYKTFAVALDADLVGLLQYSLPAVGLLVVARSLISEHHFKQSRETTSRASLGKGVDTLKSALAHTDRMTSVVERASGKQLLVTSGQTLLDALEANELPIMSGCRMGMCGSDPVVIVDGVDNLDPPDENELNTLRRLGLEGKARLACCCRPRAGITIDLDEDPTQYTAPAETATGIDLADDDRSKVIIIGNGIAGISTAESLRKTDSDWNIVMISDEPYLFYNRMGLEAVIYGRTAMQGLYLLKEDWYQLNKVDTWLNTRVNAIDPDAREITVGTGEKIAYDKLVLATGADAFVPQQTGFDLPGVFTLRSAEDALMIRRWLQQTGGTRAVVLGGGVLGIEAAEALAQVGTRVTIVHHAEHLMNRQLDLHAAVILKTFLDNKGIRVVTGTGIQAAAESGERMEIMLEDGRRLITDILLLCVGVRPNVALAKSAGLEINRGVLVDAQMRSSDPNIYCVGDAAELPGAAVGLWSVGSEQGKIAADAILDGERRYAAQSLPPVQLKIGGIDLKCFGSLEPDDEVESHTHGDISKHTWTHLCVRDGRLSGGVFVNAPLAASAALNAAKKSGHALSREEIKRILFSGGD